MIDLKPSINIWHDFKSNQIAGMWLFFGSRKSLDVVHPSIMQLIIWGILGGCVNTLYAWLVAGQTGDFNPQGLISYALWPFIALIVGVFLSQRMNQPRLMLVPALLWLVLDTNILFFQCLIQHLGSSGYLNFIPDSIYNGLLPPLFVGLFIWQSLAVIWVFARTLNWPWWERALVFIATIATMVVWQLSVKDQPIWKVEQTPPSFSEQAFYAQSDLLNKALEQIQFGDMTQSHWYFLGVAGDSYADVFKSEIERIKEQFDTRFDTFGRSIALINNPATRLETPIASKTSIELALRRIGQQMNHDSDVLFLYMTSHGERNHFEIEHAPLELEQVDPKWLRETLDKSGIRWRVIVISACYSGSFIPALQSPDTLIITASAADKTSFGCNNEADYTYFGRAFFDLAMREQPSMKLAFEQAKQTVTQWETAQGFEPSEPQWSIGRNMELMLPQLEPYLFPSQNITPTEQPKTQDNTHATTTKKPLF